MKISGSVALVTGANRGLGRHLAEQLLTRGATVYAAARDPQTVGLDGAVPIALDITDASSVAAAAERASDVTLLINNAGIGTGANLLDGELDAIRAEMETNYFGTLAMTRALAPRLAANGGGAILNVLSVLSWLSVPQLGGYSASKAAEWSLTNAIRQQLRPQGTQVSALHVGYMDTDLTHGIDAPKLNPGDVAKIALDGLETGELEILADEVSRQVRTGLSAGLDALYP